ncbi:hypothetical protein BH09PSE2_BH09PSE2_09820 [soil metagenome]
MTAAAVSLRARLVLASLLLAAPAKAFAQAPAAAPGTPAPGPLDFITGTPLPLLVIFMALFYFMILRPQQQRAKAQQTMISAIKRGDTVVLSNGVIGKVSKVEDKELGVEIATGVIVKVVRSMVSDVRNRETPAVANDPAPKPDAKASGFKLFGPK